MNPKDNDIVYSLTFGRSEAQGIVEDDGIVITDELWSKIVHRLNNEFMCDDMWDRFSQIVIRTIIED